MDVLVGFNFWSKAVDLHTPRSAQAILRPQSLTKTKMASASSCGQGACNCGGGCNGECATSCEA